MRTNTSSHLPGSPDSPLDLASCSGTPETTITSFSPELRRSDGHSGPALPTLLFNHGFRSTHPAPPQGSSGTSARRGLSPTATTFTPSGLPGASAERASSPRLALDPIAYVPNPTLTPTSGVSGLDVFGFSQQRMDGGSRDSRDAVAFGVGTPIATPNGPGTFIPVDALDVESRSRAFMVDNAPSNLPYMALTNFFDRYEFHTLRGPVVGDLVSMGRFYVAFTDSRDAKRATEKIQRLQPTWRVIPLTAREYVRYTEPSLLTQTSDFEGHLLATVFYDARNPELNRFSTAQMLQTHLLTFGNLRTFYALPITQESMCEFHIEFFDTCDAANAMASLNESRAHGDFIISVLHLKLDLEPELAHHPTRIPSTDDRVKLEYVNHAAAHQGRAPRSELSPTGRSIVTRGEHAGLMDWMARAGERILPPPRREMGRVNDFRANGQNTVDIERIRMGLDVRTTIMLRNIPNKVSQPLLKAIVDETSIGKYDFMYLRIDFANNCNVGYAFINFEDPIDIVDFVLARAGYTWNCFNSDKVAEVSYATIQGRDCLIQKFRNSSVMLEDREFRPKLFFTGNGPLAGTEDRFPGPDNPSKMRRSIENAENIGLFTPRVSQQYRLEQRRRRSLFERGVSETDHELDYVSLGARDTNREIGRALLNPLDVPRGSRRATLDSVFNNDSGTFRGSSGRSDINEGARFHRGRMASQSANIGTGSHGDRFSIPDAKEDLGHKPLGLPGISEIIRTPLSLPDTRDGITRSTFATPRVSNDAICGPLGSGASSDPRRTTFSTNHATTSRRPCPLWSPTEAAHGLHSASPRTRTFSQGWNRNENAIKHKTVITGS